MMSQIAIAPTSILTDISMAQNIGIAFVCGAAISLLYKFTYRGAGYSVSFDRALVTLSMITAIMIMVVGNNLARAFGLVGAMSIIRFRTALKDPQDLVFVFFSLGAGLAAGVGLFALALLGTLTVGSVILFFSVSGYGMLAPREFVLQFAYSPAAEAALTNPYVPILEEHCRTHRLINMKAYEEGGTLDVVFYVNLRKGEGAETLTRALAAVPNVQRVNIFYDEEPV